MTLDFTCKCGATRWHVSDPAAGTRVTCYCADCQSAARHLEADVLDEGGGTDILQVATAQLTVEGPALAVMRLSKRGLFRWHTSCCNTPVANTLGTPKLSFAGVLLANRSDPDANLPKTQGVVNTVYARGRPGVPPKDFGMGRSVFGFARRALAARLSGKWRETPFFAPPDWAPVATPRVLSRKERNAARP